MAIAANDQLLAALAAANITSRQGLETSQCQMDRALQFTRLQTVSINNTVKSFGRISTIRSSPCRGLSR
jgi:hypothetical protein